MGRDIEFIPPGWAVTKPSVLGTDGEEVTSLLGNMPGGPELWPNHLYTDNAGNETGLSYPAADGMSVVSLPKVDPYEEIYLAKDVFYRLVNPAWLDPGVSVVQESETLGAWDYFADRIDDVKAFHAELHMQTHGQTYQFYSEGLNTCDKIIFQRHTYDWMNKGRQLLDVIKSDFPGRAITSALAAPLFGFSPITFFVNGVAVAAIQDMDAIINRGGFRCYANKKEMDTPKEADDALFVISLEMPANNMVLHKKLQGGSGGDATVPVASAAILPALETVSVGKEDESYLDRDHEPIFKTQTAQGIVFVSIENLSRLKIRIKLSLPP